MSVLIKGMEMPDRCGRCFFVRWSNLHQTALCTLAQEACFEDFSNDYKNRRADFCPLVDIPTPHGRLIAEKTITEIRYHDADGYHIVNGEQLCELEIDAETVIEAEGSETNA